ncbi:helix-turn-helix and ligand-binding sensor domain-containing protein [Salegentibacter chungangensis]|uniref:LuxR C-terminal-related transcriptional regulator n=1 Tax=Salegentibacter chungangensis TaxID=1335724 RepID=A0ABW3NPV4_9FLAO
MRNLTLLIYFVLCWFVTTAQTLSPPIENHTSVYYEAASQNWGIAIDQDGIVYTANHQGLLSFDGQRWQLYPLETGAIIRSVYPYGDRVYTGSYKEFGYWSRDAEGQLEYTSLIPHFENYEMKSEEIWQIVAFEEDVYFRSFNAIYKYDGSKVNLVAETAVNELCVYRGKLLVAVGKKGLFQLNNKELIPLENQEILEGETVLDIETDDDELIIGTRNELFKYDGERVVSFPDEALNTELSSSEFNRMLKFSENKLLIGTIQNGLLSYDLRTEKYEVYNRNVGLQNNTVLGIAKTNGNVWLALDNGIDEIHLKSPIEFYTNDTGELGAVYDIEFFNEDLYLASNTGVYTLDERLKLIGDAQGHSWNLEEIDGSLFSNHNTGTYKIENYRFIPADGESGSYQIKRIPSEPDLCFIGSYLGLKTLNLRSSIVSEVRNIDFPVKKIVFEDPNTIWVTHPYEGIYRIGLNPSLDSATEIRKIDSILDEPTYNAEIYKINNHVAVFNQDKWFRYNPFQDALEVFPELEKFNGFKLLYEAPGEYWFSGLKDNSLVYTDFKREEVTISFDELDKRLVKGNENLVKAEDSIYYVSLNDGFARIDLKQLLEDKQRETLDAPMLMGVVDSERAHKLDSSPEIAFNNAREIKFFVANPGAETTRLNYKLTGSNEFSGEVENGTIKFQNLEHGDYRLELFSISAQKNKSEATAYHFSIAPPWYLSNLMKLVYILIFLSVIAVIYWFNRLKLNKQQWLLEQKFEKEHQERINKLEKQRLVNEINLKRKELANSTMMAAKKNEVLMEIEGELKKDKDKFSNQFRVKHIMNKINSAIKNKDEWKVFETNFNELHEDFFKDLLEEYPNLSSKDLKLCSYLKMNLTSKEIAPLMGISVRGVEVHRYRLRKKMGLDSKVNLSNFLIKNF